MSAALSKSMIIKPKWVKQNSSFRYHDSEQLTETWPSLTKLSWVVKKEQMHTNKQKWLTQSQKKKDLNQVSDTI